MDKKSNSRLSGDRIYSNNAFQSGFEFERRDAPSASPEKASDRSLTAADTAWIMVTVPLRLVFV